ncbi:MAG: lysophospholipid acyltransferase family protein [Lautropia sp.]|nr:lysophospholipid acyltransferase family protein [Lautropia sp.]
MNLSRILLVVFRILAALPYSWLRHLGNAAGVLLYYGVRRRTHIARVNLSLCFPQMPEAERNAIILAHCKYFARSFLDRFMLWYRPVDFIRTLVTLENEHLFDELAGKPLILLAPHFLGMDAGGTRLTIDHTMFTMFANQKNKVFNEEMRKGRARFSGAMVLSRQDGLRGAIRKIRQGVPFYFLPDMDLGARDSVFVPFFGVSAATVTSVARLAQMTGARVLPCVTLMTDSGYRTRFYPAWDDFPGEDVVAATRRMNAFIEERVLEAPAQYLWTHKRFKTRPPGEPDLYRFHGQPIKDGPLDEVDPDDAVQPPMRFGLERQIPEGERIT